MINGFYREHNQPYAKFYFSIFYLFCYYYFFCILKSLNYLHKIFDNYQCKLLYTIWNNIEVYEEPVATDKENPEFEAGEENTCRIEYESLYCFN